MDLSDPPWRLPWRIADEAVKVAEQLRQAEADGKGRGRLSRLRAAWRGV
jgi:hypothetical protein